MGREWEGRGQEERRQCWRVVLGTALGVTVRGLWLLVSRLEEEEEEEEEIY
jgi:hypothetical protein